MPEEDQGTASREPEHIGEGVPASGPYAGCRNRRQTPNQSWCAWTRGCS